MTETRLTRTFKQLKAEGRKALITFVVAGDPTPDATPQLISTLFSSGSDVVEIGIPFSDPAGEGPTIRKANERAMVHSITVANVLSMVSQIRVSHQQPLVILTYYNLVFRYGPQKFVQDCVAAGVDGLIIPDLPYEERDEVAQFSKEMPLDLITMYSPLSKSRASLLTQNAEGFLYCISSLGTTGARAHIQTDFTDLMKPLAICPDLPRAIGFGISTTAQVADLKKHADGLIVGSAIVACVAQKNSLTESQAAVSKFVKDIRNALDAPTL